MCNNKLFSSMINCVVILFSFLFSFDTLKVDVENSKLNWIGRKVTGEHSGYVHLVDGWLAIDKDIPVGGIFTVDMTSITTTDIESPEWSVKLDNHLKNNDFFAVDSFPFATIKLISSNLDQDTNLIHTIADLTIRGITNSTVITFELKKEKKYFSALGSIEVDRTLYNIKYKSDKFFDDLGDKIIYDNFIIDFNLKTKEKL